MAFVHNQLYEMLGSNEWIPIHYTVREIIKFAKVIIFHTSSKNWLILYWGLTSLDYINTFINLLNMFANEQFQAVLSKGYNLQLLLQVLVWKL